MTDEIKQSEDQEPERQVQSTSIFVALVPAFLFSIAGCSTVPVFAKMFAEQGISLPPLTAFVTGISPSAYLLMAFTFSGIALIKDFYLSERWVARANGTLFFGWLATVPTMIVALFLPLVGLIESMST
ncbi:hypothetical protein JYT83_00030 [bacterium AH-315-F18]|nr:hypothetical protein [bacterium AH-315-F18]